MLANIHSKHKKHTPLDFMYERERLRKERAEKKEPMSGEQILARFRQLGVQVIDKRSPEYGRD